MEDYLTVDEDDYGQPFTVVHDPKGPWVSPAAVFPLYVMAGAEWNVLDSRGIRFCCFKFENTTDSEKEGAVLAAECVAKANKEHSRRLSPPDGEPVEFGDLILEQMFGGKFLVSGLMPLLEDSECSDGTPYRPVLLQKTWQAIQEHKKREGAMAPA